MFVESCENGVACEVYDYERKVHGRTEEASFDQFFLVPFAVILP